MRKRIAVDAYRFELGGQFRTFFSNLNLVTLFTNLHNFVLYYKFVLDQKKRKNLWGATLPEAILQVYMLFRTNSNRLVVLVYNLLQIRFWCILRKYCN